jgi:hypothetical protein
MKATFFILVLCLIGVIANAHTINYELDRVGDGELFQTYLRQGFTHIIPLGLDHILFILCVFFLNTNLKTIILQASIFTFAHSITLALAVYGYINPPSNIVEPIIAMSIALLAIENIFSQKIKPWRIIMIFLFGLVHGMGFAGALDELGMPRYSMATALVSFNIGVEIGQISIILGMYLLTLKMAKQNTWYRNRIVIPANIAIGLIAFYWTFERIFMIN